jgi:hypothetical protein
MVSSKICGTHPANQADWKNIPSLTYATIADANGIINKFVSISVSPVLPSINWAVEQKNSSTGILGKELITQTNAKELEMEPEYNLKSSCPASVSSKIGIKTEFLDANVSDWVKI